jgi:hypothetical protein
MARPVEWSPIGRINHRMPESDATREKAAGIAADLAALYVSDLGVMGATKLEAELTVLLADHMGKAQMVIWSDKSEKLKIKGMKQLLAAIAEDDAEGKQRLERNVIELIERAHEEIGTVDAQAR